MFQMGKVHKDIAMFMMETTKDENSTDQTFIKVFLLAATKSPPPPPRVLIRMFCTISRNCPTKPKI